MIIGAVIYCLLQVAFIGALKPSLLVFTGHGWVNMGATNTNPSVVKLNQGPFWEGRQPGRNRLGWPRCFESMP